MTILNQLFSNNVVNVPTTTETAIMSTPALFSGQQTPVYVGGSFNVTPGTGTTSVTLRVRQGGIAGTIIFTSPAIPVTAGNPVAVPLDILDSTGVINGLNGIPYTVTIQQTGATGNGSVNHNYFRVEQQ